MMSFGEALQLIKQGERMYRLSWVEIVYVYLVAGSKFTVNRKPLIDNFPEGTEIEYRGHIDSVMSKNNSVDESTCGVWSVTQDDVLADDWLIHQP